MNKIVGEKLPANRLAILFNTTGVPMRIFNKGCRFYFVFKERFAKT
jgi:hypothetical protein